MSRDLNGYDCHWSGIDSGSARVLDEWEQAITIMKDVVFSPRFGFENFVVSERESDAHYAWLPSIIGTRFDPL
jgi:hypothetical protein